MTIFSGLITILILYFFYKKTIPYTLFYKPLKALMNGLSGSSDLLSSITWLFGRLIRLVFQLLLLPFKFLGFVFSLNSQGRYGSAHWLGGLSKWRTLNSFNKGFVIDGKKRIPEKLSFKGLSLIAPSGAGKSVQFVIPNIMYAQKQSLIVTDPSGELLTICGGILAKKGYKIKVFSMEGNKTLCYNPLHRANNSKQINKLAKVLIDSASTGTGGNDSFWNSGAENVLSMLIHALKNCPPQYQNLANVRYLLNNLGVGGEGINEFMAINADEKTFQEYKAFTATEEKVASGFVATARTALGIFADDDLCSLTSKENLHFESIRDEKTAIFIQVPESSIRYYSPIITVFYTQLFDFLLSNSYKRKLSVMCLLDEFGNLGRLPDFDTIITTIRKRKVAIALILQDLQQLSSTYGQNKSAIILHGGTSTKIALGGLSAETCNQISNMMGVATVEENGLLRGTSSQYGRKLMTPDEIRMLPESNAIFIHGNLAPSLVKLLPYYKNWQLKRWAKIPTPILNELPREPVPLVPLTQENLEEDE